MAHWQPTLGAWPSQDGFQFRIWAPEVQHLEVVLESSNTSYPLHRHPDGTWARSIPGVRAGERYSYRVNGGPLFPDPVSRFQPEGVHGPSQLIDPQAFPWSDQDWRGLPLEDLVFYELHLGTFTPDGSFQGALEKLALLRDLGITAVELMPIADFPGKYNWGYDGVSLFAPARCYGSPDDLRRLVNAAHQLGLAVFLDVVYNHLGPDGNYTGIYSPYYFSKSHHTPWGDAINFDGPHSEHVRAFVLENALYWIHEFHMDGLRLDATHAILDDSREHILAELSRRVHEQNLPRRVHLIAEDHRNLAHMVQPRSQGGWGLDGIWADDFHHELRRLLAGDCEGYYSDYQGTVADLATTINQGWYFTGQFSDHLKQPRGTDPAGLPPRAFVICLQNHDQVGNRALGERLHHQIDPASFRAASVLLLCSPATPLLFMGQEWACSAPFRYFTDHEPGLGRLVTEGRRQEFRHFSAFTDPASLENIPDPQDPDTFAGCVLDWNEREQEPHQQVVRLYQRLLRLRRQEPALRNSHAGGFLTRAVGDSALILERRTQDGSGLVVVLQLRGAGQVDVSQLPSAIASDILLSTEEPGYCSDPHPVVIRRGGLEFQRPGAAVLRCGG